MTSLISLFSLAQLSQAEYKPKNQSLFPVNRILLVSQRWSHLGPENIPFLKQRQCRSHAEEVTQWSPLSTLWPHKTLEQRPFCGCGWRHMRTYAKFTVSITDRANSSVSQTEIPKPDLRHCVWYNGNIRMVEKPIHLTTVKVTKIILSHTCYRI